MRRLTPTALLLLAGTAAPAADKFDDLTPLLPSNVNAVAVCDVQSLYDSPLGQREQWAREKPLPLPPQINTVALGSRLDPDELRGSRWEVGVARLKVKDPMEGLAQREKGAIDIVAGATAVLSPRNVYFVEFRPWIVGMLEPANRQDLAQWVRDYRSNTGAVKLSPFLKASVTGVPRDTQFVLALDLADALPPEGLRRRLAAAPALAGRPADVGPLVEQFAGLQGARLTLRVDTAIRGELAFEFARPPAGPAVELVKPLLLEFLADHGAAVEALEGWSVQAAGNAVVLRGDLPEKGLRRVLSLILPPTPSLPPDDPTKTVLAAEVQALASLHYFKTVAAYLEDMKKPSTYDQKTTEKFALWFDNFAEKIEKLPTGNVDEALVKYGQATAARLHAIAASLRGEAVDVQKLEQSIGVSASVYAVNNGWGRLRPGVWLETNQGQVRAQQAELVARGQQTRQQLLAQIDQDTATIRQQMAAKYERKF
jgi:hypothetical protein